MLPRSWEHCCTWVAASNSHAGWLLFKYAVFLGPDNHVKKKITPSRENIDATETICYVMALKPSPTQSNKPNYNPHTGLNITHTDVILSLMQHLVLLSYWLGVEFQCTSGRWALLLFPSTVPDRETHTTWLNSHKLSFFSVWLFHCLSTVQEEAGGDCSSGSGGL